MRSEFSNWPDARSTFFIENFTWNCTGQGPFAGSKGDFDTTRSYWQAARGTYNPFEKTVGPGFPNCTRRRMFRTRSRSSATCQFPGLTAEALDDALVHGQDLRAVYGDLLGFLPNSTDYSAYAFRATNNVITTQTASGLIRGLMPDLEEHAVYVQPSTFDSLEPTFSCPLASSIMTRARGPNTSVSARLII